MKHHFLPAFYLRGWSGQNGEVVEYKRTPTGIKPYKKPPTATGYMDDLYRIAGAEVGYEQVFETGFLKIIDDMAARAIHKMLAGNPNLSLTEGERWVQFILSLEARSAASVETLKEVMENHLRKHSNVEYETNTDLYKEDACKAALILVKNHILNKKVYSFMSNMHGVCVYFNSDCHGLLTSDRPILRTNGLDKPYGQLVLPLSPNCAFLLFNTSELARNVTSIRRPKLAAQINTWIVEQADTCVYAENHLQAEFVNKHFARKSLKLYFDYRKLSLNWQTSSAASKRETPR